MFIASNPMACKENVQIYAQNYAAVVEEAVSQVGGITRPVPDGLEQGLGFRDGGGMAQAGRAPGAEGINVFVDKRSGVSIYDPAMNDFRTVALSIKGLHLSGLGIKLVQ